MLVRLITSVYYLRGEMATFYTKIQPWNPLLILHLNYVRRNDAKYLSSFKNALNVNSRCGEKRM